MAARLERLAQRYVPGAGPVTVEPLGTGLVNHSYRVSREGRVFSLRLAAPRAGELGLDRQWECRVLRCAAAAGLAPAVECCEPAAGIVVSQWAEGIAWTVEQASSPDISDGRDACRRVHALPVLDRPRVGERRPVDRLLSPLARGARRRQILPDSRIEPGAGLEVGGGPPGRGAARSAFAGAHFVPQRPARAESHHLRPRRAAHPRLGICACHRAAVGSGGLGLQWRSHGGLPRSAAAALPGAGADARRRCCDSAGWPGCTITSLKNRIKPLLVQM